MTPPEAVTLAELRALAKAANSRHYAHPARATFREKLEWHAPMLLAKWEECERLRETLNKALEKSVRLSDIDNKVRAALCNCKSPTDHEDECAALQPLAGIAALKSRLAAAEAVVSAAKMLEVAELIHANCEECEGLGVPELCGSCFPHFDDARVARRNALSTYGGKSQ